MCVVALFDRMSKPLLKPIIYIFLKSNNIPTCDTEMSDYGADIRNKLHLYGKTKL